MKIIRERTSQVQALHLHKLNEAGKLTGKATALDNYKEWVMAVGSGKVEHVGRLVKVALANKRGIRGLLEMHERAAQGVYKPQGYMEEDSLCGLLFWRLAGARVANIAHCSLGLPSVSTLRRHTIMPPLVASPTHPTVLEVKANVQAWYKDIAEILNSHATVHQVLMLDELKVEERPRWDDKSNMILGVCWEHGNAISLSYTSKEEAKMLLQAIEKKEVHLAVEVSDENVKTQKMMILTHIKSKGNSCCSGSTQRCDLAVQCTPCSGLRIL